MELYSFFLPQELTVLGENVGRNQCFGVKSSLACLQLCIKGVIFLWKYEIETVA